MTVEQFDKLNQLTDQVIGKYRQLRFENVKLQKDNFELKKKLEILEKINNIEELQDIEKLHLENERLKEKNSQVKNQLQNLIAQLEQKKALQSGVGS
jgi:hypothetical protein